MHCPVRWKMERKMSERKLYTGEDLYGKKSIHMLKSIWNLSSNSYSVCSFIPYSIPCMFIKAAINMHLFIYLLLFEIRKLSSITRFDNETQKKLASLPILVLDSRSRFTDLSVHSQPWFWPNHVATGVKNSIAGRHIYNFSRYRVYTSIIEANSWYLILYINCGF